VQAITAAVAALDERSAIRLVDEALKAGESSLGIVRAAEEGMRAVGERYERQEIFLSGLIMAGEIFRGIMQLAQPGLENELVGNASGRVLLGTVSFGFTVEDLGVNVPAERFLEAAKSFRPDIVGLSGLLFVAFTAMRDVVNLFKDQAGELGKAPIIMIGGGTIDQNIAGYVGADYWTTDAMEGVRICQRVMEKGQAFSVGQR
jgi:5-methyltetrahydrofolate--homocysteine methyltransferase